MSLRALWEIFWDVDRSELPDDLAAYLARDAKVIWENKTRYDEWNEVNDKSSEPTIRSHIHLLRESCSSAAQYRAAQNVDRWITSKSVLTRITRKFNGPRAALHGAAQQRIWIPYSGDLLKHQRWSHRKLWCQRKECMQHSKPYSLP
jgi:hypothetical protein